MVERIVEILEKKWHKHEYYHDNKLKIKFKNRASATNKLGNTLVLLASL